MKFPFRKKTAPATPGIGTSTNSGTGGTQTASPAATSRLRRLTTVLPWFLGVAWESEKPWFFRIVIQAVIWGVAPLVSMVALKYLIDEIVGQKRWEVMVLAFGAIIAYQLFQSLAVQACSYFNKLADTRLEFKLDRIFARKLATMDCADTENSRVLDELDKAKTGLSWYSGGYNGLRQGFTYMIMNSVTFAGTFTLIGMLNPWLILALGAFLSVRLVLVDRNQKYWAAYRRSCIPRNRRFNYYFGLIQRFQSAKDARLYQAKGLFMARAKGFVAEREASDLANFKKASVLQGGLCTVDAFQQIMLYLWLGIQCLAGACTLGQFQMILNGASSFAGSLANLLGNYMDLATKAEYLDDFRRFMLRPVSQVEGSKLLPDRPAGHVHFFEFRDVWFAYPGSAEGNWALKGLNLTLKEGQRLSVVGENGAGKTTMIKLLTRLYDPDRGQILLDGIDIHQYTREEYRRLFAVVFQDFKLFSVTLEENLSARNCDAGPSGWLDQIQAACIKTGVHERVSTLPAGYGSYYGKGFSEHGVEFSGGEAQKLAIARSLVKDARENGITTPVLDEPTAALDPVAEYEVYHHFDELIGGKTAIYISHRLSSCRFCDAIAVFHGGELIEHGSFEELVARPEGKFRQLWEAQSKFYR